MKNVSILEPRIEKHYANKKEYVVRLAILEIYINFVSLQKLIMILEEVHIIIMQLGGSKNWRP